MDELGVLRLVAGRLAERGFEYMVTGSMAMAFYAQPRMTRDVDLVVALDRPQAADLASAFAADFLMDETGLFRAVADRGMFNLSHMESAVKVDMIVRKDDGFRCEEFRRRRQIQLGESAIWVVSAEDLILSKLAWSRESRSELQSRDVRALLQDAGLDRAYLHRWAPDLGVEATLAEAFRQGAS